MAALGYDSALVLVDAIKRAGSTDGARIREALAATKNFAGVTGATSMDAERNASKAAVIVVIKDGQFRFFQTAAP
jgi:branched-chain amino acid transport system substrate-binding protein